MKITSTILMDFIQDFKLDISDIGVCFNALIDFNLPTQNFNLMSEVHMEPVLMNSAAVICLLDPVIEKYNMPTLFSDVNHHFIYFKHKGLMIAGHMPIYGAYTINIIPKSQQVAIRTLKELRSKKFN